MLSERKPILEEDTCKKSKHKHRSRKNMEYEDDDSCDSDTELKSSILQSSGEIAYLDSLGNPGKMQANPKFNNYQSVFENLLKTTHVETQYLIQNMELTKDATTAILVTKKDDSEYYIRMFDLETQQMTFSEMVGGSYIKMD